VLFDEQKFRKCLPAEMLKEKRFVRYFLKPKPEGGTAKIPLGNHSDPSTWSTFDDCVAKLENDQQGLGYNFLGGDIHGLDIDHCRNAKTGAICNEAMLLLSRIPSWSEYSVSGQGLHVFFKGQVRGKQLTETCLQYWNPKNSPRFFALTCDLVGEAFTKLRDIGEEFNYIFATARHISAKIREELKAIDPEQWAALPAERQQAEPVEREKQKSKTLKLHKDFDLEDFLKFYGLGVDNVSTNNLGKCYRVNTCPIKGEPHVGQNSTTTNFILSSDGGLGFHCQSTGCVEYSVAQVIKKLAEDKEPYPHPIYEARAVGVDKTREQAVRGHRRNQALGRKLEHKLWLWPGYLFGNQLVHLAGASAEGKSPLTRDLIARFTSGRDWPDGSPNISERRGVLLLSSEDDWSTDILPHLTFAGADLSQVYEFVSTITKGDKTFDVATALDEDVKELQRDLEDNNDIGLIIVDPITNYLGRLSMNKEDEVRPGLLMPLANLAHQHKVCILSVGHLNKRTEGELLDRVLGARAFTGVARQTLFCAKDSEDENKFAHIIGLGRGSNTPNLKYKTVGKEYEWEGQRSEVVLVEWGGVSKSDIEGAVLTPLKQAEKSTAKTVRMLVKNILRDGQKPTEYLKEALQDAGIDVAKFNWQREASKVAESGKGGIDKKGEKFFWWLAEKAQMEFDK